MNWGKGIITGMVVFMLFIISMCIYMFMIPVDDYDHQYYEKGLSFNRDHDREEQVVKDQAEPAFVLANQQLLIKFRKPVSGRASFMRPSDNALDKLFQLNSGKDTTVHINLTGLRAGPWQLTLEWKSNRKDYLYHHEIVIP